MNTARIFAFVSLLFTIRGLSVEAQETEQLAHDLSKEKILQNGTY